MRHYLRIAAALLLALMLFTPALAAGETALPESEPLVYLAAGESRTIVFVPPANSEYAVCLFPTGASESRGAVEVVLNGELIAGGAGQGELCSAWLVAGQRYEVRLHASVDSVAELARSALSRCFAQPLEIVENEPNGKMIARAYDAHWYEFTAEAAGRLMLTCVPEEPGLALRAMLFDSEGTLISEFEELPGGACLLLTGTRQGERYALRVSAPGGETGYYFLRLHRRAGDTITNALRFSGEQPRTLAAGSAMNLGSLLSGEALLWVSDAPEVAAVTQDGAVIGLSPGTANITAYGISSQASFEVQVIDVPLTGLQISNPEIELEVGESAQVEVELIPRNASERRLSFKVADEGVATVTDSGEIVALAPGETTLTVTDASGAHSATASVRVEPAGRRYRALLVGEQHYPFGVYAERNGSENSVNALAGLLNSGRFERTNYSVRVGSDLSRAELIAAIRETFGDAVEGDVALIYITCHGHYTGGMSFLELSDGSALSARDLERELRRIAGDVVLLLDCCGSGGAIGAASERANFAGGIAGALSGAAIRGGKYRVLCSAGLDEDSYRLAFNEDSGAGVMATVFARAICDGAGWDLDRGTRGTMGADVDYDGAITLGELALYVPERVDWYLERASELTGMSIHQSVSVEPKGDPFVLFE